MELYIGIFFIVFALVYKLFLEENLNKYLLLDFTSLIFVVLLDKELFSIVFIILSQWWLLYTPDSTDFAMPAMQTIFSNTPRLMITSMVVYAIVQEFDVWAYHKWWDFTNKLVGDRERFLWLRNNGSTLISQFLNNILLYYQYYSHKPNRCYKKSKQPEFIKYRTK